MKIMVFEGSPNKRGSSNLLTTEFIHGAKAAGHLVQTVDAAHAEIHPCTGCIHCGYEGPCVQKDEMNRIREMILDADMLVFVTPVYYYGMSAQLKTLVDRFCAFNSSIQRKRMKSALLAVACDDDNWTFKAMGMVLGAGCGTPEMTRRSKFPKLAYELGKRLS